MSRGYAVEMQAPPTADPRVRLQETMPVAERRLRLAGIPTALLEGGEGAPMVLLHGPGEFAEKWLRVFPELVTTHRVIAPDLPGHGASGVPDEALDEALVLDWLDELIEQTCPSPPVIVGHVLGGAIGARYAITRGDRLGHLVLVDTLGLAPFRPKAAFALTMMAFLTRPTEASYTRFMRQCSYDLDRLRDEMGELWEPFVAYTLDRARAPSAKAAGRLFREVGLPQIPPDALARITVPTTLIWGRQDRANRLRIAEAASKRYGWPLHVIEDCADDPPRDAPEEFLRALRGSLDRQAPRGEARGDR
ncbi:MAG TPA: alpha/beta hydrolase [Gemmatimonadaceae bacterium]|nr:alpha/beta hydrolase [Gemmatimonadaceae bacterium]